MASLIGHYGWAFVSDSCCPLRRQHDNNNVQHSLWKASIRLIGFCILLLRTGNSDRVRCLALATLRDDV